MTRAATDGDAVMTDADGDVVVDVGLLVAHSPRRDGVDLAGFADRAAGTSSANWSRRRT